jgi:hypothetical protein
VNKPVFFPDPFSPEKAIFAVPKKNASLLLPTL